MKLDELKKMIQEEFESYMQETETDVNEADVDVTVGDDDVDATMDKKPEEALEKIYQMLQDYFEADGEDNDMDGMTDEPGEEPMEEAKEEMEEGEDKDLDENSTMDAKYQKTGMAPGGPKSAGPNVGYGEKGGKGRTGFDAGSKAFQERFQKLANIKTLKG